jgi:hypothetical protein
VTRKMRLKPRPLWKRMASCEPFGSISVWLA